MSNIQILAALALVFAIIGIIWDARLVGVAVVLLAVIHLL
jgi:hypothetical protein